MNYILFESDTVLSFPLLWFFKKEKPEKSLIITSLVDVLQLDKNRQAIFSSP